MQPLSEDELKNIYEKIIKPRYFNDVISNDPGTEKVSVFLGGQSGSGKSYLNQIAINELENKSAVTLDTDMLRSHHPYEPLLAEKDVYSLDKDCYKWGEMLITDSIKENKNILFDGTFGGNTEVIHNKMNQLREHGYKINATVLSVNDTVSKIGIQFRYESIFNKIGRARPVDIAYHDQVYTRIPGNLLTTLSKGIVDEFNIYGRNHQSRELRLINSYDRETLIQNSEKAVIDFVNERTRELKPEEVQSLSSWYKSTEKHTVANGHDLNSFRSSIQTDDVSASIKLKDQIDEIIGLTPEQRKRISDLRKVIEANTKEIQELQGYKGELRKQSLALETNLVKSIKVNETMIKVIVQGNGPTAAPNKLKVDKPGHKLS